ncbi:ABC transporter substrate-binding protein [Candidatus Epulonipiscioides gigas]|nr:ABC transporter substrate-binding protein [Epulopiscium sp. SCG-C07WGA-EpuloA2]
MKAKHKNWLWFAGIVGAFACYFAINASMEVDNFAFKYEAVDLTADVSGIGREGTYSEYQANHSDAELATKNVNIDLKSATKTEGASFESNYEGKSDVLMTEPESFIEWEINLKESGLYNVEIEYYPSPGKGTDIERAFYINGEIPFNGADKILFTRLWGDAGEVKVDNQGNEIRPSQIELPEWNTIYLKDYMGYEVEPFTFYFDKGKNKIALEGIGEPMAIKSITLKALENIPTYEEYSSVEKSSSVSDFSVTIPGEMASLTTSPSLYATYDRSSPGTNPYSISKIKLNIGGGYAYRVAGQWIEWDFEVPEDGYYNIDIKGRQNYQRGFVSNRAVYIDGKMPFAELSAIPFKYNNEWELTTLSANGEDAPVYLEAGAHTIRLQVTLGDLGEILGRLEDSVFRLNAMYRKILVLTGTVPDSYRDYRIEEIYPDVIESMELESKRLYKVVDDLSAYAGEKSSQTAIIETLARQLEDFVENPDEIPGALSNFNSNISALGTSIITLSEAPIDVDEIIVRSTDVKKKKVSSGFLSKSWHEVASFFASFFTDYNSLGNVYENEEVVDIWVLTGRDQSTVVKNMIDDTFTPETGIKVNVKLVAAATLMKAVIAGNGPDVVLTIGQGEPVNYALRNAVEDLSQFEDFEEIFSRFYPSAYEPFEFEGGMYAIPETQTFDVLFFRTDIMTELGLEVPDTWQDLIDMLPVIQQNNMSVAIPSLMGTTGTDPSMFLGMLYQNGGDLYSKNGDRILLDTPESVAAFETYTKFFTHYKLPSEYNFLNRFRSGEMPIGVQGYGMFNSLAVFAPEIRGLWDFALMPGTEKEDGTIDRTAYGGSAASMMLKQDNEVVKSQAWEFLKWWTDAPTQLRFGREMESILGSSARYATANIEAFTQLPWTNDQQKILMEQWKWVDGTEQIAGGYYTFRHITNAVRNVVNNNNDPRETLLDYTKTINEEIEKKRLEFGLEIYEEEE